MNNSGIYNRQILQKEKLILSKAEGLLVVSALMQTIEKAIKRSFL